MIFSLRVLFSFLFCCQAYAQTLSSSTLQGKVEDPNSQALVGANVSLRELKDSSLVTGTFADTSGHFVINQVTNGDYYLIVTFMGFKAFTKVLKVDSNLDMGTIQLAIDVQKLSEVTIRSRTPIITRLPDRTRVNIEKSIYSTGENAFNLLNIVPEVRSDGQGNINFRGQQNIIVYIDNRRIRLSGTELLTSLRSIPSESISSIEVLPIPGAEFEAEGTAAVINIITKKEYRYGLTGTISANYSYNRYPGTGTNVLLKYKAKKLELFSKYNYSYFNFFNDQVQQTKYTSKMPNLVFDGTNAYLERYHSHSLESGLNYDFTSQQSIGFNYRLDYTNWHHKYESTDLIRKENFNIDSVIQSQTTQQQYLRSHAVNGFYILKLDTLDGSISLDYNAIRYINSSDAFYKSRFYEPDYSQLRPQDSSFINNPIQVTIQTAQADFNKSLGGKWKISSGFKYSNVTTNNANTYFRGNLPYVIVDAARSNEFVYKEQVNAAYSMLNKDWNDWSLRTGLRLEKTKYTGESLTNRYKFSQTRLDLFPSLFLQKKLSDLHLLNIAYGRRISRPDYKKLNPFQDYENPYSYSTGNPDLRPSLSNSYEMSYLYKSLYSLNFGYKKTSNIIGEIFEVKDQQTVVSTYKNLNTEDYLFVSSYLPFEFAKGWNGSLSTSFYNKRLYINDLANNRYYSKSTVFIYLTNSFQLPKEYSVEVSGYYQSTSLTSIYTLKPQSSINVIVKKSAYKNRLNLTLSAFDIFYTQRSRILSQIGDVQRDIRAKFASRTITLGVSYNLSKGKRPTDIKEHESSGADEEDRI